VATNIASISGANLEVSQSGVAACIAAGLANCSAMQTTFVAPPGASSSGPVDSLTGVPVDFQYISGNLARNAGQTLPLYRFDVSLTRAFKIPKWESASLEFKMDVFNVFNHPLFILNNANDVLNFLSLPQVTVNGAPNPNFNCTASCLNPFTGLYLGAHGQVLTLANFQRATFDAAKNFNGLGAPPELSRRASSNSRFASAGNGRGKSNALHSLQGSIVLVGRGGSARRFAPVVEERNAAEDY
jgi:hypothetical protein